MGGFYNTASKRRAGLAFSQYTQKTMNESKSILIRLASSYAARFRFPTLLAMTAVLFVVDLLVPDILPFADELILGLLTLLLAAWRGKGEPEVNPANAESAANSLSEDDVPGATGESQG
jgi:hypothetical protein